MRVCNTCGGTGVAKNLHNWISGGKREQDCWNCHETIPQPAQSAAPEAMADPDPDQLRAIARTARNGSGSASDDCGPLAYVLHGWRAAAIAFRAKQAALVEAQQPAPSAAAAVVVYEQKENEMQVWFRPARMHGHPERTPIKATITKDRGNGIVDLTYDDGEFSGNARAVPNALRLPRNVREQVAVWWDVGFEMDFQTAVNNSLKKKKDDPPPQPSTTPQADSQPAPQGNELLTVAERNIRSFLRSATFKSESDREAALNCVDVLWEAARAPANSVTAPAGGATGKNLLQVQVWAIPDGNGGGQFSWQKQDERYWTRLTPPAQAADSVLEDAALSQAARDVLAERQRQISAEGWTPAHDDEQHLPGELALAAASYVCADENDAPPAIWPWALNWWKPRDRRRNLTKAGALILAEMELLDRAALKQGANHE